MLITKIKATHSLRKIVLMGFLVALVTGCAAPSLRVAEDLLVQPEALPAPLVANGYEVAARIDPTINNAERIDESVKQSLVIALNQANVFGEDEDNRYRILANVEIASQAAMSFGNFNGKLQVAYKVFDENSNKILEKTIYTEAGSDKWHFSGAKRHARARSVNISKNVLEFIDFLKTELGY